MNSPAKIYTWRIVSAMKDGDEFTESQSEIDWGLFVEYCKAIVDKRILWPGDLHIYKEKVRRVG